MCTCMCACVCVCVCVCVYMYYVLHPLLFLRMDEVKRDKSQQQPLYLWTLCDTTPVSFVGGLDPCITNTTPTAHVLASCIPMYCVCTVLNKATAHI